MLNALKPVISCVFLWYYSRRYVYW